MNKSYLFWIWFVRRSWFEDTVLSVALYEAQCAALEKHSAPKISSSTHQNLLGLAAVEPFGSQHWNNCKSWAYLLTTPSLCCPPKNSTTALINYRFIFKIGDHHYACWGRNNKQTLCAALWRWGSEEMEIPVWKQNWCPIRKLPSCKDDNLLQKTLLEQKMPETNFNCGSVYMLCIDSAERKEWQKLRSAIDRKEKRKERAREVGTGGGKHGRRSTTLHTEDGEREGSKRGKGSSTISTSFATC